MKVQQVPHSINPFGGIHFVIKQCKQNGLDTFINEQLGSRGEETQYSYSDGLLALAYSHLCGASCIEDLNTLARHIGYYPGLQLPSADTMLRILQALKAQRPPKSPTKRCCISSTAMKSSTDFYNSFA